MEKVINKKDFVSSEVIKTYQEIDWFLVMKELLMCKGDDFLYKETEINKKQIEEMCIFVYGLKSNSTNKLYVGVSLDKFFRNDNSATRSNYVKIPQYLIDEVNEMNKQFRETINKNTK